MLISVLFLLFLSADISKTGDTIEVENYRCEVKSERQITCENIGRVCAEARKKAKASDDLRFGCYTEEWQKKHPGKTCDSYASVNVPTECWTLQFQ